MTTAYIGCVPTTRAQLAALTSTQAASGTYQHVYISETGFQAVYDYNSASTATPNGTSVIIPVDSPASGRWLQTVYVLAKNVISSSSFGIVGDGSDETSKLSAFLNAGSSGAVLVVDKCASQIVFTSAISATLYGGQIIDFCNFPLVFSSAGTSVSGAVSALTFTGTGTSYADLQNINLNSTISLYTNTVDYIYNINAGFTGLTAKGSWVKITNPNIQNFGWAGIALYDAVTAPSHMWVSGGRVYRCRYELTGNATYARLGEGLLLTDDWPTSPEAIHRGGVWDSTAAFYDGSIPTGDHTVIDGVVINSCGQSAIYGGGNDMAITNCTLIGNYNKGVDLDGGASSSISGIVVSGCTVNGNKTGNLYFSRNIHNSFIINNIAGATADTAIAIGIGSGGAGIIISNNFADGSGVYKIWTDATVTGAYAVNNLLGPGTAQNYALNLSAYIGQALFSVPGAYTYTFPGRTDTLAALGVINQTWSGNQIFSANCDFNAGGSAQFWKIGTSGDQRIYDTGDGGIGVRTGTGGVDKFFTFGVNGTFSSLNGPIVTNSYVVSALPAASVAARAFVTDATQTLAVGIGTTVVGGGTNKVPVYSDGTNWLIG